MSNADRGKPVEFRKAAEAAPAARTPEGTRHVLRGQPAAAGEEVPHVEFFGEEDVDGFPSETPRWVAFCPDCGAKLALKEHEACPFFGGPEKDRNGFVVAVHCGLPKSPPKA